MRFSIIEVLMYFDPFDYIQNSVNFQILSKDSQDIIFNFALNIQ